MWELNGFIFIFDKLLPVCYFITITTSTISIITFEKKNGKFNVKRL